MGYSRALRLNTGEYKAVSQIKLAVYRPLHIVCGIIERELLVITAYEPSLEEWKPDWKTRR